MQKIKNAATKDIHFRVMKDKVQVLSYNKEDFKNIQLICTANGWQFHTYTLRDEKPKILVIRGMDSSVDPQDIIDDLQLAGLNPVKAFNIMRKKDKSNLFQVNFPTATNINNIIVNHKYICNYKIVWEKLKKKSQTTQCRRCQRFGHSASNCQLSYRCVKCTNIHEPGQCKKSPDATPRCVNCNLEHPANYGECISKINYLKNRQSRQTVSNNFPKIQNHFQNNTQFHVQRPPTTFVKENLSFAQIIKPPTAAPIRPPTAPPTDKFNFSWLFKEVEDVLDMDFFSLMDKIKIFGPEYNKIQERSKQRLALADFLCQLY